MRPIPKKLRDTLNKDPFMAVCCLADSECDGRIEFDHTIIHQGRQLNERWAIVPVCEHHHDGQQYKERRQLVALNRASWTDLLMISKAVNWIQRRDYLRTKYPRLNGGERRGR
jgi:hypothetical protein